MSFCSHCGTPLKEEHNFCVSCGRPVYRKPSVHEPTDTEATVEGKYVSDHNVNVQPQYNAPQQPVRTVYTQPAVPVTYVQQPQAPQQQYVQPHVNVYYTYPEPTVAQPQYSTKTPVTARLGFILSLVSVALSILMILLAILFNETVVGISELPGIAGIILSAISLGTIRKKGASGKGLAISGLIVSIFAVVFALIATVLISFAFGDFSGAMPVI